MQTEKEHEAQNAYAEEVKHKIGANQTPNKVTRLPKIDGLDGACVWGAHMFVHAATTHHQCHTEKGCKQRPNTKHTCIMEAIATDGALPLRSS